MSEATFLYHGINYKSFIVFKPLLPKAYDIEYVEAKEKSIAVPPVFLPLPKSFEDKISTDWGDKTATNVLMGVDVKNLNWKNAGVLVNNFLKGSAQLTASNFLESLKDNGLIGGAINSAMFSMKTTVRPQKVMLFNGIEYRDFSFDWEFLPESKKEAEAIVKSINILKKYSLPQGVRLFNILEFFGYPCYFDIDIYINGKKQNKVIFIKRCVITNINTNFGDSGGMLVFKDGIPNKISFSISLKEIKWLTQEEFGKEVGI